MGGKAANRKCRFNLFFITIRVTVMLAGIYSGSNNVVGNSLNEIFRVFTHEWICSPGRLFFYIVEKFVVLNQLENTEIFRFNKGITLTIKLENINLILIFKYMQKLWRQLYNCKHIKKQFSCETWNLVLLSDFSYICGASTVHQ